MERNWVAKRSSGTGRGMFSPLELKSLGHLRKPGWRVKSLSSEGILWHFQLPVWTVWPWNLPPALHALDNHWQPKLWFSPGSCVSRIRISVSREHEPKLKYPSLTDLVCLGTSLTPVCPAKKLLLLNCLYSLLSNTFVQGEHRGSHPRGPTGREDFNLVGLS